ncbi:UDP-N-acetylmuramate dehydrogenase [Marinactinospora thermotolerans]|uniref:UDP-N-acetylenolpyruvoylglucosamine reductase n=1 Tax=Marinactinospora thermotolerans DSM 45154 TaxID=1122192 RepID=A0A1T4STI7_9ACTN|nr:UDP-N-acetylmuramate dehydrogenase [Marinactinospora thermotolerans]SKA31575.1 UDP-N-acetylmuramate dehydrogenase [Marinactinospora thermotolerans DSM 45154]
MPVVPARNVPLAGYTTLGLGGPAATFLTVGDTDALIEAVSEADAAGEPLLVLGGGSNLVVADEGFAGTVVHVDSRGVAVEPAADGEEAATVRVRAAAGVEWEPLVRRCVEDGLSGIECLSGIPGRVGSTPIQNVGAYGQEVSQTIAEVVVYDRELGATRTLTNAECEFAYRDSVFKGDDRYVVCEVVFALTRSELSRPIRYAELARRLGVEAGDRVPLADARAAVLELRRGKGMVIDPADPDTRSAGSFFTNPILSPAEFTEFRKRVADRLGPEAEPPAYPAPDGRTKTSAAWLIDRAGFGKGYGAGPARISTKHTLALTNRGGARTEDLLALAREVRAGVAEAFGVTLVNEPVMVGVAL